MFFNKVIVMGNLVRDVELRYSQNGQAVATITLAINRRYKKQDGSQSDEVCYVDAKLFGRTAEVANQYLKRGSSALVEGRLTQDNWVDANGQKRSKHSVFAESLQLGPKPQSQGSMGSSYDTSYAQEDYSSYNPPAQRQQTPQGGNERFDAPTKQQAKQSAQSDNEENLPVIDIDEEEIPF